MMRINNTPFLGLCAIFMILPTILVGLIWLPFGGMLGGVLEEWDVLSLFTENGVFLWAGLGSPMEAHRIRPLTIFPHSIAYALDPSSFKYWNVILGLILVGKAISFSTITRWILQSNRWAILSGFLIVLYPADTMQISFRALHINASLTLILFACVAQVYSFTGNNVKVKFIYALIGTSLMVLSVLMYETALLLSIFPYILLVVRYGYNRAITEFKGAGWTVWVWLFGIAGCIIHIMYIVSQGQTYQVSVTGAGEGALLEFYNRLPLLFKIGFFRSLVGGWYDSFQITYIEYQNYTYVVCSWIIILVGLYFIKDNKEYHCTNQESDTGFKIASRIFGAGLILIILGYIPYLTSAAHVNISQRTYLFATPGAVFVTLSLFFALSLLSRVVAWIFTSACLFFALSAQLYQFHHYVNISNIQKKLLHSIVENIPDIPTGKNLIVLDESQQLSHTWLLRDNLHNALTYLYGKKINKAQICLEPGGQWQEFDQLARPGSCKEEGDRWVFSNALPVSGPNPDLDINYQSSPLLIPKKDAFVIKINLDGTISNAEKLKKVDSKSNIISDHNTYVGNRRTKSQHWPFNLQMFRDESLQSSYKWDFGRWWSMEIPTQGSGWREAEWRVKGLHNISTAWKVNKNSSLVFEIAPLQTDYLLKARFTEFSNDSIKNSLILRLNGSPINYTWNNDVELVSFIPNGSLNIGLNVLDFVSDQDPKYFGLSMSLDWFTVEPLKN